jgi:hypothetical protein
VVPSLQVFRPNLHIHFSSCVRATHICHPCYDPSNNIWWRVHIMEPLTAGYPSGCYFLPLGSKCSHRPFLNTYNLCSFVEVYNRLFLFNNILYQIYVYNEFCVKHCIFIRFNHLWICKITYIITHSIMLWTTSTYPVEDYTMWCDLRGLIILEFPCCLGMSDASFISN